MISALRPSGGIGIRQQDDPAGRLDDAAGTGQRPGQVGEGVLGRVAADGRHDHVDRFVNLDAPAGIQQPLPFRAAVDRPAQDGGNFAVALLQ